MSSVAGGYAAVETSIVVSVAQEKLAEILPNAIVAADKVIDSIVVTPGEPMPEQAAHDAYLNKLFKAMFAFQILLNIVDGCLPASLVKMGEEIHLSFAVEGAMGGLVYLGLVASSLVAGPVFDRFSVRKVIAWSSFSVGVFVVLFGLAPNVGALLLARFGIGVSLAFITIYAPVWVDEFAPKDRQTMWMSLLQLAIPLGVMVGYGCGILTSQYGSGTVSSAVSGSFGMWRAPFIVQGLVVLPVALCILLIPDEFLQRPPASDALALEGDSAAAAAFASSSPSASPTAAGAIADLSPVLKPITPILAASSSSADSPNMAGGAAPSSPGTMLRQRSTSVVVNGLEVKKVLRPTVDQTAMHVDKHVPADRTLYDQVLLLLRNHVFVYTVLGLTALFFVVTGIQFWVTPYLVLDLEQPVGYVGLAFIFASATGPTCGVLFGGYVVDRNGGYKGTQQTAIALRICLVFVAIAVSCCILCIFAKTLLLVIAFIWLTLFFGGALVPPATGILMSCVPGKMRNFASACAQMVYNLFGYCLSPLLSGAAMEATGSRAWGFRVVMLWSGFGAIFVFLAWRAAVKKATFPRRTTGGVRSPPKGALPASSSPPAEVGIAMPPLQPLSLDAAKPTASAQQQEEDVVTADAADEGEFGPYPDGSYVAPAPEASEDADVEASAYADEFDDEFSEDDFPSHTAHDVKIQMIYHRGARHSSIADFSALLPAWLQAKASGRSNDQFADQDLIMENNGVVKSV